MSHIKARMSHRTPGCGRTGECPKRGDWWGNRIQEIGKLRGDFSSMALLRSCPNKDSIAPVIQLNSTSLSLNSFLLSLTSATVSKHTCCKWANWKLGLRNALHFSVSRGVIQRKERGPAKWQLAAYNRVHNKRMADGDRPTSTVNPQRYLQTRPSGTGSLEQYKIHPTC